MCAETIKAQAKLCPHCRTRQGRHVVLRQELLFAGASIILLIVAFVAIKSWWPEEGADGGRSFAGHESDLVVLESVLTNDPARGIWWLTGVVSNRGTWPWRVHELEVRFIDDGWRLLDARHADVKGAFVVLPGQTHGFRVPLGELSFTNGSVTRQVRVQVASDGTRARDQE